MINCLNCNAAFDSSFCPSCGQKKDTHRLTAGHVAHEALHSITHADKGFFLLVKELAVRPGIVAKEYIEGKRKRYFNPLSFLVISSAIFAYLAATTGFMQALTSSSREGRVLSEAWQEVFSIANNSGKWLTILLIAPVFAFLTWIFFLRKKLNYPEHFVLQSFIFGQAALFRTVVLIPLFIFFPAHTNIF